MGVGDIDLNIIKCDFTIKHKLLSIFMSRVSQDLYKSQDVNRNYTRSSQINIKKYEIKSEIQDSSGSLFMISLLYIYPELEMQWVIFQPV